jgi:hypothetical protein
MFKMKVLSSSKYLLIMFKHKSGMVNVAIQIIRLAHKH